jgi:hypothetical protein
MLKSKDPEQIYRAIISIIPRDDENAGYRLSAKTVLVDFEELMKKLAERLTSKESRKRVDLSLALLKEDIPDDVKLILAMRIAQFAFREFTIFRHIEKFKHEQDEQKTSTWGDVLEQWLSDPHPEEILFKIVELILPNSSNHEIVDQEGELDSSEVLKRAKAVLHSYSFLRIKSAD